MGSFLPHKVQKSSFSIPLSELSVDIEINDSWLAVIIAKSYIRLPTELNNTPVAATDSLCDPVLSLHIHYNIIASWSEDCIERTLTVLQTDGQGPWPSY